MTRLRACLAGVALLLTAGCSGSAGSSSAGQTPSTHDRPPAAADPSSTAPSARTTPSASPSGSPPGTHGPSAKPSARSTAVTTLEAGFPNARTTGPRSSLKPRATGNMSIKTDGTVIKGWDITGSLDIYADNVTIIDSRITSTNWWGVNLRPGFKGLRILHTTITAIPGKGPDNGGVDYAVSNMGASSIEVGWCDISVFGNALSMGQGNIHDNYVHGLVPFRNAGGEWQHTDAVISGGGNTGQLIIRHNTLLNPVGIDQGASASIGLFADTGHVSNTVVDNNLLAGGAYALYGGGDGATGITVTNNVFSTRYHRNSGVYGSVTAWNTGSGNVWRGNRYADGTPVTPEQSG